LELVGTIGAAGGVRGGAGERGRAWPIRAKRRGVYGDGPGGSWDVGVPGQHKIVKDFRERFRP